MRAAKGRYALAALALACGAGPATAQPPDAIGDLIGREVQGEFRHDYLEPLLAASCRKGDTKIAPEAIPLTVKRVALQGVNPTRKTIGDLTLVGGFHLLSSDKRFGGLSGIDITDDGRLLAVSDVGDFVWFDLAEDGVTPETASIASMRDAKGVSLRGKSDADAEGLALNGGVALVSFEGNHRILAYDLGKCGPAVRGIPINDTALPKTFARENLAVDKNSGVEALAVTPDWMMLAGIEQKTGKGAALSARAIEGPPVFDLRLGTGAPELVGLDVLASEDGDTLTVYSLHRSTNALATNAIMLLETPFAREFDQANLPANVLSEAGERSHVRYRPGASRTLAAMNLFVTIDNFEGVAAKRLPDGRVRLYVVSDDNFASSQRTLLMVYDVTKRD